MEQLLFSCLGLLVLYVVVRKAVTHGILEADEHREVREERARAGQLEE